MPRNGARQLELSEGGQNVTDYLLKAEGRIASGKGVSRRIRREGNIPAVIYGHGEEGTRVQISQKETGRLVSLGAAGKLVKIELHEGAHKKTISALFKDVQVDPIGHEIIHADFQKVDMGHKITTKVPVHFFGEEKRPNDGSLIEHVIREIEISCLPDHIPERFEVNVSGLQAGHSIFVKDLAPGPGVEIHTPAEEAIVSAIVAHHGAEDETAETGAAEPAAAEPAAKGE